MSLYALPVSTSDLTQLQLGIEFFTNTTEATTEAAAINAGTDTVYGYAVKLLSNNISLSQVAMAVDSLMFGVTDNVTELTKLAMQFLPAQVANAVAHGFNPTVYAAEALGLGLAGGNGTSNAFATDFGSLSVPQFASAVASLTGINSGAIQGFVQNWTNFYTANPSATFGLSATLAAYGAAFGDAVGAALVNPTFNGTLALLTSEVENALIDNAEGLYKAGIPLITEPPHTPLQGEAVPIPNAGGAPYGPTIDWAAQFGAYNYAQFVAPKQSAINVTINNAPSNFTLDTQHYGDGDLEIKAAGGHGNLFTLILGDSSAGDFLGTVIVEGYSTTEVVVAKGPGPDTVGLASNSTNAAISGSGSLNLSFVEPSTITDVGVSLTISDLDEAKKIDASNAPLLVMSSPALDVQPSGVTIFGGTGPGNILQGAVGDQFGFVIAFSNSSPGLAFSQVQADNLTGGSSGGDSIFGDGGADTITLPNHTQPDLLVFGEELFRQQAKTIAITDGLDRAYLGFWGTDAKPTPITGQTTGGTSDAIGFPTPIPIPNLFPGQDTGGTSADMTVITGFAGFTFTFPFTFDFGDVLAFKVAAWNGDSAAIAGLSTQGDLVVLNGIFVVPLGAAQLSSLWLNSGSNSSLKASDNVLLYAPSDASLQNAQQLAAQLHTSSDAVVLQGGGSIGGSIGPGEARHILVAYDAGNNVVNLADVDLVNTSASNQSSTANLNVYASDMVHLTGVSLTSLTPDNIHFI
jgi:hypothetical protein